VCAVLLPSRIHLPAFTRWPVLQLAFVRHSSGISPELIDAPNA
jgi:hypothetical protein